MIPPSTSGAPPLQRWRGLLVWLLSLLLFQILRSLTVGMSTGDSAYYVRVAEQVGQATEAPYAFRVAMPYAAALVSRVLEVPLAEAFRFLQMVCFASLMTLLYLFLETKFPREKSLAVMGLWLFAFSYPGCYNVHNTSHVGFAEHLVLICGFWSIHRGRYAGTAACLFCAALIKEPAACLLIAYYALQGMPDWRNRPAWTRHVARTAGLLAVAVAAAALPRLLLEPMSQSTSIVEFYQDPGYRNRIYTYFGGPLHTTKQVFMTFGPLWAYAAAGFLFARSDRRVGWWIALATGQVLFALDVQRVVGCAYPGILLFTLAALQRTPPGMRWLVVATQTLYFIAQNHGFGMGAALLLSGLTFLAAAAFWSTSVHPPLGKPFRPPCP